MRWKSLVRRRRSTGKSYRRRSEGDGGEGKDKEDGEGRIYVRDIMPKLTITSPYIHSKVDSNTFTMDNPMPEPVFVNLIRSPGIDSQPDGPVRKPYLSHRAARLHRLSESIAGLPKRLQIRAQSRP